MSVPEPSDSQDPGNGPSALQVRKKRNLWVACDLQRLSRLVDFYRQGGKIQWTALASAWERSRGEGVPRSVAALKAAYAKYLREPRSAAAVNLPCGAAHEDPQDSLPGNSLPDVGLPLQTETFTDVPVQVDLKETLIQRFNTYYRYAIHSYDRRPVRRPVGQVPQNLLKVGNDILASKIVQLSVSNGRRWIGRLNAMVYAIARAIAATADELREQRYTDDPKRRLRELEDLRRTQISTVSVLTNEIRRRKAVWRQRKDGVLQERQRPSQKFLQVATVHKVKKNGELVRVLRKLKDQLNVTQLELKKLQEARRRKLLRRRGPSFVAQERSERPTEVPVAGIREYWRPIVGEYQPFEVSPQLEEWSETLGPLGRSTPLKASDLTEEAWRSIFSKVKPWKATGPDGIQAFWWKHLPAARLQLKTWCVSTLRRPRDSIPTWLCQGRVVLIPKKRGDPSLLEPSDFRPIACLNTCYKILTSMIGAQVSACVGDRFPGSQVALRKGTWGCLHAQILDQTVIKDAERSKQELHMMWVDMAKAFDSLRHGAILWTVKQWGVSSDVRRLLSTLMKTQSVRYCGYVNGRQVRSRPLKIRNGLMQGDSLSPLLFCLAIAPISAWIQAHVRPYQTKAGSGPRSDGALQVGHVFYMDDLKVFTPDWYELTKAKNGIQLIAGQLGLALNNSKCAIRSMNSADVGLDRVKEMGTIPILGGSQVYKYLGAEETTLVCFEDLWSRVAEHAMATAKRLFFSNLTVRQKVNGYNQIVVPKLKYAFSCIIFGAGRFRTLSMRARNFDTEVRRLLEESHLRFGHSCVARLYVEKDLGGLGLKCVEEELHISVSYTWSYLATNTDLLVSYELAERLRASSKRSLTSDFKAVMAANEIEGRVTRTIMATIKVDSQTFYHATEAARAISKLIRERWAKVHLSEWRSKEVAGRILQEHGRDGTPTGLCLKDSFLWSANGWISSEVLRNVWAAQEASLLTGSSAAMRALRPMRGGLCRMHCGPFHETAEHIVSACAHWRTNIMVERHDDVARVLYSSIRKKYGLTVVVNTHRPHVVEATDVVVHWNDSVVTSEGLVHNRPDLLVWDKRAQRIWIIEISVSWYTRILSQEQRKLGKYGVNSNLPEETGPDGFHPGPNLKSALQRDRKCRVDVIPIVIGACGEVTPNLRQYVRALELPDDSSELIEKMQRNAVLGSNRLIKCHLANRSE
ncbi:reverse transcriptase [Trichostrongylus colubriformis]|uniref:Reverse transcriptase n=1 Tax=Trichostrongylus colubriformis TaxID=6319 RepID=A0AAN8J227_TRICO